MTSTRASYAARTNLAPPTPTNEEGPTTFAISAGIRARSREDPRPPRRPHCQKDQSPNPLDTREKFKGPPPTPTRHTAPPQTKENPYTPGWKFRELNSIQHPEMPWNSTGELPPPPPDLGSPPCNAPPHPNKPRD
ncbi:hypothetical protein C0989_004884 [Termitomyces sp. Mn162]|nr:hypothetical protein C0989_004884 [Termitomyces sp. Mn162]